MNSTIRTIGACMLAIGIGQMTVAQETTKVPKVAIMWTFAENEKGTSEAGMKTADDLLRKLFEQKAGYEIVSNAVTRAAWRDLGFPEVPNTVEEPGQLPLLPDAKKVLELGKKAGADFVCVGTLTWHVKSIWVGLGPKTKANALVSMMIVDVSKAEVVLEVKDMNSDSTKAEKWYESAGALLLTWGITLFSGGPKTPHIQKAAVKAIGAASDPYFAKMSRKIGGTE